MKNINLKFSLFLLLGMSAGIFYLLILAQRIDTLDFITTVKLIPKVVTFDLLIVGFFSTFFWKLKIFKGWLVPFSNLNGTWKGHIQTTWIDPKTKKRPAPIPAILTINQSFFNISCVMRTSEMTSRSIVSDFVLDKDNQMNRLIYSYDSNPIQTVKERSPQHYGTMAFDLIEKSGRRIVGEYWTGRKTTGQIEMSYWKKEKMDHFPDGIGKHPVSEVRKNNS